MQLRIVEENSEPDDQIVCLTSSPQLEVSKPEVGSVSQAAQKFTFKRRWYVFIYGSVVCTTGRYFISSQAGFATELLLPARPVTVSPPFS